jgi:hypothetical protein
VSIESVYNLNTEVVALHSTSNRPQTSTTPEALQWLQLPPEQQFRYACFWDWFYNKVVNSDVLVSYNFSSPDVWRDQFSEIGYRETTRVYLGIDQPLVPEFHVLQVFDAVTQASRDSGDGDR